MATLVLTAVGTAVGGPLGGLIGATLGQAVDGNILFKPSAREGPRLTELAVQTSSYGSLIPRVHGTMRVAGSVVWATDLQERREKSGGGKGRPSTTSYSYSVSFAVALSSRRCSRIGRIWADGKLLRGAAGDFKSETGFRFHPGTEDQPPDGFIASVEGGGAAPAYRGIALAVFEDMALADYGNRIPSLTFELIADDRVVTIGGIVDDISAGLVVGESIAGGSETTAGITGYSASGESRAAALEPLLDLLPIALLPDGDRLRLIATDGVDASVDPPLDLSLAHVFDQDRRAVPEITQAPETAVPRRLALRYYDPERDYQSGLQRAFRTGAGRIEVRRDFPATLTAPRARALAEGRLRGWLRDRTSARARVALAGEPLTPGRIVRLDDSGALWRVRTAELFAGFADITATRVAAGVRVPALPASASPGRAVAERDAPAGPTALELIDLPFDIAAPGRASDEPRVYAVASGAGGWRGADLFASPDGAAVGEAIGRASVPGAFGRLDAPLPAAPSGLRDERHAATVTLAPGSDPLHDADAAGLLAGANIAMVGDEVVQFACALPLDPAPDGRARYRLSSLLRGLGGSEWAAGTGTRFVALDPAAMVAVPGRADGPRFVAALGRGDAAPVFASLTSASRALLPWSPVHPRWDARRLRWTRRSRAGSEWRDHVGVPLVEETESYRVELGPRDGAPTLIRDVGLPELVPTAEELAAIGPPGTPARARVRQVGRYGQSPPCVFDFDL